MFPRLRARADTQVGTSLEVAPCNVIPYRAKHCGSQVAFVNINRTPLDEYADFIVRADVQTTLPRIAARVKEIVDARNNSPFRQIIATSTHYISAVTSLVVGVYNYTFRTQLRVPSIFQSGDEKRDEAPRPAPLRRHAVPARN